MNLLKIIRQLQVPKIGLNRQIYVKDRRLDFLYANYIYLSDIKGVKCLTNPLLKRIYHETFVLLIHLVHMMTRDNLLHRKYFSMKFSSFILMLVICLIVYNSQRY